MTKALCPGSFDPVTNGHLDVIERAARHFDHVLVAIIHNPSKQGTFSMDERKALLRETISAPNVEVDAFSGLLVDFARSKGIDVVVKGLRAVSDFEYELQMAQMNRKLTGVDTMLMVTSPAWSFLSSSLVREVAMLGGDVSGMVPAIVQQRMKERFS